MLQPGAIHISAQFVLLHMRVAHISLHFASLHARVVRISVLFVSLRISARLYLVGFALLALCSEVDRLKKLLPPHAKKYIEVHSVEISCCPDPFF